MIKKVLFLLVIIYGSLFANTIKWESDYSKAVERATKEKKAIIFFLTRDNCRFCIKLSQDVLTNESVIDRLNSDFVPLSMNPNSQNYPNELRTSGVPTMWILSPDGYPVTEPIVGVMSVGSYIGLFDAIKKALDDVNAKNADNKQTNSNK